MGYYLKQLTDDKAGSAKLANSKEEVFGIGPGIHLITNRGLFVEAKCIFETGAVNRFSGTRSCLRLTYSFNQQSNNSLNKKQEYERFTKQNSDYYRIFKRYR